MRVDRFQGSGEVRVRIEVFVGARPRHNVQVVARGGNYVSVDDAASSNGVG